MHRLRRHVLSQGKVHGRFACTTLLTRTTGRDLPSTHPPVAFQGFQHGLDSTRIGSHGTRDLTAAGLTVLCEEVKDALQNHESAQPAAEPGGALRRPHQRNPTMVPANSATIASIQASDDCGCKLYVATW